MDVVEELSMPLSGLPLPSVLRRSESNEESNDLSQILLPPKVRPYPLYTEIVGYMAVWREVSTVYMSLGEVSTVYMRQSPEGSCSGALWTVMVLWSQRSLGRRLAALF